jgi:chromosome segregation ATPase
MSSTLIAVDCADVERSFREWQAEQSQLEAELADSFAALEAYQSNLDNWQAELAQERAELHELRTAIESGQTTGGEVSEQHEALCQELADTRQKISSLTTALLARTEELRDLDHQRNEAVAELSRAGAREQELSDSLAAHQQSTEAERQQWEQKIEQLRVEAERAAQVAATGGSFAPDRSGQAASEARASTNAVLGSVMEQFGKLRKQRSMNRLNPKPR